MSFNKSLNKAIELLKSKCGVEPEKYAVYNGAFIFLAYPPNVTNKSNCMNPYYLVDLKYKDAGLFSPAFDLDGFFEAVDNMKSCR